MIKIRKPGRKTAKYVNDKIYETIWGSMIRLSYSSNGLTNLQLFEAIDSVEEAGYQGIELSFQEGQFDPFQITDDELVKLKNNFQARKI